MLIMAGSLYTSAEYNYQNVFRNLVTAVILIGAIVFPFALGIQCSHLNKKNYKAVVLKYNP